MSKCLVYAGKEYIDEFAGLAGACAEARAEAIARPGVRVIVQRDSQDVARYRMAGGQWIERWVR